MEKINLYVHTDIKGKRTALGHYIYVLEFMTSRGPATLTAKEEVEDCTNKKAELRAINSALKRLTKPCAVLIHAENVNLLAALQNEWYRKWEEDGWKNSRGLEIEDTEEWQEFSGLMKENELLGAVKDDHSYLSWMVSECEKEE